MQNTLREIDLYGDGILRLREHLVDWAEWTRKWKPKLGYPSSVPYARLMRGTPSGSGESRGGCNVYVMHGIERALSELRVSDEELYLVLMIWYLNESVGAAVFRSPRLRAVEEARLLGPGFANEELSRLREEAERALLPLARKHNVVC